MLKAVKSGSYFSKAGNFVVRYNVTGTNKELAAFAAAQSERIGISLEEYHAKRMENGGGYLFTITPNVKRGIVAKPTCNLDITQNGKVVVDISDSKMKEFEEDSLFMRQERIRKYVELESMGMTAEPTKQQDLKVKEDVLENDEDFENQQLEQKNQLKVAKDELENLNDTFEPEPEKELVEETTQTPKVKKQ